MSATRVSLFADFTSPFCYLTEELLWPYEERGEIEIRYFAFELFPAPSRLSDPDPAVWADELAPLLEATGLELNTPGFRPRTRKAHEAALFARAHGAETPLRRAIYRAYWRDGEDIGRIDLLCELGEEVELGREDMKIALDIDAHSEEVEKEHETARRLNVPGAPTIYVGTGAGARVLIGAHSPAALDEAIRAG